ncbi:polysaccharide lyase family 1 protein [Diplocarpon rosae]|nr:polysaccharide lyase family 1 protein [Diplocarpon rosae]
MLFGNWFQNSDSRNPMMTFGTFYIMNNLFMHADQSVEPYQRNLSFNLGVNTESNVLVGGNVFMNNAENGTKIFRFSTLSNATLPARLCIPAAETGLPEAMQGLAVPGSSLNGLDIDLKQDGLAEFQRSITGNFSGNVEGSLQVGCDEFAAQPVPTTFSTSEEVEKYVRQEAGQRTVATNGYPTNKQEW